MNKQLVDLQRFSSSTCAIIKTDEAKKLPYSVVMKANVSDGFLSTRPFAQKLDEKSQKSELCYFVIKEIDELNIQKQERFLGLIKDREFMGYNLPNNCIVVLTAKDESTLKNLSPMIYHLSVVAM